LRVNIMYQTIAAEGVATPQRAIRSGLDANGPPLARYPLASENRLPAGYMHLVQFALEQTMREGTGQSAYQILPPELNVAGKTGTTNDQRDSWFAGFSGDHLAVVWVGRDDNGPTPLTGATGAMGIWTDIMSTATTRPLSLLKPAQVDYFWVQPQEGGLSAENCEGSVAIPFVIASEPRFKSDCQRRKGVFPWFNRANGSRVEARTE